MNKRIILVGPTCAGKNYIRSAFIKRGYTPDISYTSRNIRPGEKNAVDYYFTPKKVFEKLIKDGFFFEWVNYNDEYYGTSKTSWNRSHIFIMESDGIKHITAKDRKNSIIMYVNTTFDVRLQRMRERGWSDEEISNRVNVDINKFKNFTDFDIEISSEKIA